MFNAEISPKVMRVKLLLKHFTAVHSKYKNNYHDCNLQSTATFYVKDTKITFV